MPAARTIVPGTVLTIAGDGFRVDFTLRRSRPVAPRHGTDPPPTAT